MPVPPAIETNQGRTMVLEAYADTILPGEKRWPGDRAVAGVSSDGGAVAAGALLALRSPEGGLAPALDALADGLDEHAEEYAAETGIELDPEVPAFVSLDFPDRVRLVQRLTDPTHPEREAWISLAMFSVIAFDAAAHSHTVEALDAGHVGLKIIGFRQPDSDGLWRFDTYSYGRQLAQPHPDTTASGSPA
ncbi:regulator [Verrucosispora sp. FIM060022]|uniref:Regulator n=3 Tax=Micromonosporaceae TaxID=28056 RepID=A0A9X0LBQ3_9ACTN|nr:regulator [Micromonospora maris]RUL92106.1 regulator [Verrucosispora sp. FIM060022]